MTLFDFIILAFILFYAYFGWEVGMWTAGVAALELLACLSLAVLLHEPVAGFLLPWIHSYVSSDLSQTWLLLFAFAGLAWGPFAAIRYQLHKTEAADLEHVEIDPLSDRIGGVIAGAFGGAIFVGGVLITASMTPFVSGFKPSGDKLALDVGKLVLVTAGHFVIERPDGYVGSPLPIVGGPASDKSDMRALLTCDPWCDVDGDGIFDETKDRYRDVNADGVFTPDLYCPDVEGSGQRRVGLIDKYVAGCWDTGLMVPARKRTDVVPPKPKKKPPKPGESTEPKEEPIKTDF